MAEIRLPLFIGVKILIIDYSIIQTVFRLSEIKYSTTEYYARVELSSNGD